MLKNKKYIRVLLPLVIVIYGVLFYRIFDTLNPDSSPIVSNEMTSFSPPQVPQKEKFTLVPIDSDPFLGTLYKKKKTRISNRNIADRTDNPWPTIEYLGLVTKNGSKASVFILNIDGVQVPASIGETLQGIKVVSGNEEFIRLRFNGRTKEFPIR